MKSLTREKKKENVKRERKSIFQNGVFPHAIHPHGDLIGPNKEET